jgi:imidazolonepropionase-like amidohydrolase
MTCRRAIGAVVRLGAALLFLAPGRSAAAQTRPDSAGRVALVGVTLVDGTGHAARPNQTVLIEGERIAAIFPAGSQALPKGARVYDLTGR